MAILNIGDLFYYPESVGSEEGLFALAMVVKEGVKVTENKENAPLIFLFDEQDLSDNGSGGRPSSLAFHPPDVFKKVLDHVYRNLIQYKKGATPEEFDYLSFPHEGEHYAIAFANMSYPMKFSNYYKPMDTVADYREKLKVVERLCKSRDFLPEVTASILENLEYAERFYSSAMRPINSPKLSL